MQAAAEREKQIGGLIADHEAELKEIARLRKQKGSGHPGKEGRMGTTNYQRVSHELARLKRGLLPGEADGAPVRSQKELRAAAQLHPDDHPGAGNSMRHDHALLRAEMYGDLHARGGGADGGAGHDDLDGGGGGGGDGGDGGDGGAWDSSDDDDPQPCPKEAKVSKVQQDFIVKCTSKVMNHTADNYKFLPPCASIGPRACRTLHAGDGGGVAAAHHLAQVGHPAPAALPRARLPGRGRGRLRDVEGHGAAAALLRCDARHIRLHCRLAPHVHQVQGREGPDGG